MAETIPAVGTSPNFAADVARVLADQSPERVAEFAAQVDQAISEAELAALTQLLSQRTPVAIRTEQLQAFLRTVLPQELQDQLIPQQVVTNQLADETEVAKANQSRGFPAMTSDDGVGIPSPSSEASSSPSSASSTPHSSVSVRNAVANYQTSASLVTTPEATSPTKNQSSTNSYAVSVGANLDADPSGTSSGALQTSMNVPTSSRNTAKNDVPAGSNFLANSPNPPTTATDSKLAAQLPNTSTISARQSPVIADPGVANNTSISNSPGKSAQSTAVTEGSATRNLYQSTNETLTNNISKLLLAKTETVFGSALTTGAVPMGVTVVDPQRVIGNHVGQDAKAFLMTTDGVEFAVVVIDRPIHTSSAMPGGQSSVVATAQEVENVLNEALIRAFGESAPRARTLPLQNGLLAIVYQHPSTALRAAPLLDNAGFSLFAQPVPNSENTASRMVQAFEKLSVSQTSSHAAPDGQGPEALNSASNTLRSAIAGWLGVTASKSPQAASSKGLSIFVVGCLLGVTALTTSLEDYLPILAALVGTAMFFLLWKVSASGEEIAVRSVRWFTPWRYIGPALRFATSRLRGGDEPWIYYAHERDWAEWSHGARVRLAVHEVEQKIARLLLPREHEAFTVLGLRPTAQWKEVNAAFRILARRYHPDSAPDALAEERAALADDFQRIMSAYVVLRAHFKK